MRLKLAKLVNILESISPNMGIANATKPGETSNVENPINQIKNPGLTCIRLTVYNLHSSETL